MGNFRQNVTRIKGLSDRRRMPLLGKVRLGIKVKHETKDVTYPKETDYFVIDDAVKELYGAEPKLLNIMLPMNDLDAVFPCAYVMYGSGKGVKCKGDGEKSWCVNPDSKEIVENLCPCEQLEAGKCKQVGRLLFMIPSVSVAGVYQLSTSSFNSIIDIQSGLDYVQAMVGRFAWIPLDLKRVPTITHHNEKKQTHHTIQLTLPAEFNLQSLVDLKADNERIYTQAQYQLPSPVEENPELDPVDVVEDEEKAPINLKDRKKLYAMCEKEEMTEEDIGKFAEWLKEKYETVKDEKGNMMITAESGKKVFKQFNALVAEYGATTEKQEEFRDCPIEGKEISADRCMPEDCVQKDCKWVKLSQVKDVEDDDIPI